MSFFLLRRHLPMLLSAAFPEIFQRERTALKPSPLDARAQEAPRFGLQRFARILDPIKMPLVVKSLSQLTCPEDARIFDIPDTSIGLLWWFRERVWQSKILSYDQYGMLPLHKTPKGIVKIESRCLSVSIGSKRLCASLIPATFSTVFF